MKARGEVISAADEISTIAEPYAEVFMIAP